MQGKVNNLIQVVVSSNFFVDYPIKTLKSYLLYVAVPTVLPSFAIHGVLKFVICNELYFLYHLSTKIDTYLHSTETEKGGNRQ